MWAGGLPGEAPGNAGGCGVGSAEGRNDPSVQ